MGSRLIPRRRFWAEALLSVVAGLLGIVSMCRHNWLEAFGLDPDHGNGSVEWWTVVVLAGAALVLAVGARVEWRRAALSGG
jgi:hypothetical protein